MGERSKTQYIVKSGDNLSKIATNTNTPLDSIIAWNNLSNPNMLKIGQSLLVYSPAITKLFNNINSVTKKFNKEEDLLTVYDNIIFPVYKDLKQRGWEDNMIYGVLGNILQESVFDPALKGGLMQFRGANLNLYNQTYPKNSWQNQVLFIDDWKNGKLLQNKEVNYNYGNKQYLKSDHSTPENSAKAFYDWFERPNDNSLPLRQAWANYFADWFNSLTFKQGGKMNYIDIFKNGSGIHIKKANRGKFTDYCGGKVTEECILRGKHSSNPAVRKRATFAANARKWKHLMGGKLNYLNFFN